MKKNKIPLYDIKLDNRTIAGVRDTLKEGWLSSGRNVTEFERSVAKELGVKHVAAVNSATLGLWLSLRALGIGEGSQVITSPFTFIATIEAILHAGAEPIFADIDPDTLCIDPDEVARKITRQTGCIMPVDIGGQPSDYKTLVQMSCDLRIPIIADASHSFGTKIGKRSIAKFADMTIYSFHATKNLTCGEGGIVVSKVKPLVDYIRQSASHGINRTAYQRRVQNSVGYEIPEFGFKANMSNVHAAIGLGQLAKFEKNQKQRTAIAERYRRNLAQFSEMFEIPEPGRGITHAWHLYIIRLHLSALKIDRDKFIALMSRRGIECGVHFKPVYEFECFRGSGLKGQYFPNTAYAGERVVSLPIYPGLKLSEVDYICENIESIVRKHRT